MTMLRALIASAAALVAQLAHAGDGLRVAAWNITNYAGANGAQVQTAVYASFNGRSMDPDVILLQEIATQSALNALVSHLNAAPGSPADWAAAPFFRNGSINTALVYRQSKLDLLGSVLVAPGGGSPIQPRNIVRYDLELDGYDGEHARISFYPSHMKAGSSSSDQQRRQVEAQRIVDDAATLPAGRARVFGGDLNTQTSSQQAYRTLTGAVFNTGPFRDPIATPGSWQNTSAFRFVHTQDPVGGGGVDDRYDQILLSPHLGDGVGLDYAGNFAQPYSRTSWLDPDHSYRAWGNDGTSFNTSLATLSNSMVGPAIAQAIITLGRNSGHCPVFLDLRVPAVLATSAATLDFGDVEAGAGAVLQLEVGNAADTDRWGTLVDDLRFDLSLAGAGFAIDQGAFTDPAGGGMVVFDASVLPTTTLGLVSAVVTVDASASGLGIAEVALVANIVPRSCPADLNGDGLLDFFDVSAFLDLFSDGDLAADFNGDNLLDFFDISAFLQAFDAGC